MTTEEPRDVEERRVSGVVVSAQQIVLIVNSDPKEQRVLTVSLKKVGLSVRAASDGFEALETLEGDRGEIGVAIIDLNLDRLDGFELCERIRDDGRFDGVALIALSGSRDLATRLRAYETGFDELLEKPVYIKEIATRVELLLERRARDILLESEAEEVQGELDGLTLADLLQSIESGSRTGFVRIVKGSSEVDVERPAHTASLRQDDDVGQFFFDDGQVLDAEVGRLRGESALYRMMRWDTGRYVLKNMPEVRRRQRIRRTCSELVAEGVEQADRFNGLVEEIPDLANVYEVDLDALVDEVGGMPQEVRSMLRLFDGVRSLERVILESQFGDLETLRVIDRLYRRGQLIPVSADDVDDDDQPEARDVAVRQWLGDRGEALTEERWFESEADDADSSSVMVEQAEAEQDSLLRAEAARREEERRRLENERNRLRQEQSVVLAELARSQAQTAREQEDQAKRHVEERRRREAQSTPPRESGQPARGPQPQARSEQRERRERQAPEPQSSPTNGGSPPAGYGDMEPTPTETGDDPFARSARSIREQVVSALAEAELYRSSVAEPEPTWDEKVEERAREYHVVSVQHVLKPMTLVEDGPEEANAPRDRNMFDMARLVVSDAFDTVSKDESVDVDMGFDGTVRGPSQMDQARQSPSRAIAEELAEKALEEATTRGVRQDRRARGVRDAQRSDSDSLETPRKPIESASAEDVAQKRRTQQESTRGEDAVEAARRAVAEARLEAATPSDDGASGATVPGTPAAKREADSRSGSTDSSADPQKDADTQREGESVDSTVHGAGARIGPDEDTPELGTRPQKVSDNFDHDFFADGGEAGGSRWGTIAAILVIGAIIAAIVFLIQQGEDAVTDEEPAGPSVGAEGADDEGEGEQAEGEEQDEGAVEGDGEDPFEGEEPTEELPSPYELKAQQEGEDMGRWTAVHAISLAEQMTGAPGDPAMAGNTGDQTEATNPDGAAPDEEQTARVEKETPPEKKEPEKDEPKDDPPPEKDEPKEKRDDVKITREKKDPKDLVNTGKKLYKRGKYGAAVKALEDAVSESPGSTEANYYLGLAYSKERKYPLAIKHLEKVRSSRGKSARYWQDLGSTYIKAGKRSQGLDAYKKAVEILGPDDPTAEKLQQYIDRY